MGIMTRIGIIGAGVVGAATGKGFHKLGHEVIFYDISQRRLATLKEEGFGIVSSVKDVIQKTDLSFICVNTPTLTSATTKDSKQDLSQIMSVLFDTAKALNDGSIKKHHLLVFRSTMLPGTMRNIIVDYLRTNCYLKQGKDYDVCYNPEFLRQHYALNDFFHPDRVVIGEEDGKGISSLPLRQIYEGLSSHIITTTYEAAELIKYASNCFLSLKISFFNEIGMICRDLGIDDKEVTSAVSLDKRIGTYGTKAGRPFGGTCLPKDTEAMTSFVKKLQIKPDLLQIVLDINRKMEELTSTKQVMREIRDGYTSTTG